MPLPRQFTFWALSPLLIALRGTVGPQPPIQINEASASYSALGFRRAPDITIPIVLIHDIPFVKVSINGHEGELFSIDSGSEKSILSYKEATRLHLKLSSKPIGVIQGLGNNSGRPMWAVSSIKLKFGEQTLARGSMLATSLFDGCGLADATIAGVLGYDLLRQHLTVIDYSKRQLLIYRKGSLRQPQSEGALELKIDKSAALPVIHAPIAIEGKYLGEARIVIDTGADSDAALYPQFANMQILGSSEGKAARTCAVGGVGSIIHGLKGEMTIAGRHVALTDVAIFQNEEGLAQTSRYDLLIGGALLKRWSLVFDAIDGKIYLLEKGESGISKQGPRRNEPESSSSSP
jgi:Aspartyl protease